MIANMSIYAQIHKRLEYQQNVANIIWGAQFAYYIHCLTVLRFEISVSIHLAK
jgi:hypothetical protein